MDTYLAPGLDEALGFLQEWPDATPLAGGTDLMVEVNAGRARPDTGAHVAACSRVAGGDDGAIGAELPAAA